MKVNLLIFAVNVVFAGIPPYDLLNVLNGFAAGLMFTVVALQAVGE